MNYGIWDSLPEASRETLLSCGTQRRVAKGAELFGAREEGSEIYFLLEGFACLYRSSFRGDNRVIFVCSGGEILNELALENGIPTVAARTLSEAQVLSLPRRKLLELMQGDPALAEAIIFALTRKTRRLYHKVGNDNGTYALKNRLAAAIWKLARDFGTETSGGQQIRFEVSVNFLSDMMGAKRETVSRALSVLKQMGLIVHENGVLTVRDMPRLKAVISE